MRRLALWTAKGGTGKTTVALNLAAALAARGRRVLLIDLDPQATLTRGLGEAPASGLLDAIRGEEQLEALVGKTQLEGLEYIPASAELARAERRLAGEAGAEALFGLAVRQLPKRRWAELIIDCPPGVSVLSAGALAAVTEHIAPIDPSPYSVAGLSDALDLADAVRQRLNSGLQPSRILVSRVPRTRAARLISEGLRERFGERVFGAEIPERAAVVEASARHIPVLEHAPESLVAESFQWLADELEGSKR